MVKKKTQIKKKSVWVSPMTRFDADGLEIVLGKPYTHIQYGGVYIFIQDWWGMVQWFNAVPPTYPSLSVQNMWTGGGMRRLITADYLEFRRAT